MESKKHSRPDVLVSRTERVTTGCGILYVTVGATEDGEVLEVFATLGKSGGCTRAFLESLSRCVSIGLKYQVPLEEYVKHFRGIRCPFSVDFPRDAQILSCPDAIARVLETTAYYQQFLNSKGGKV